MGRGGGVHETGGRLECMPDRPRSRVVRAQRTLADESQELRARLRTLGRGCSHDLGRLLDVRRGDTDARQPCAESRFVGIVHESAEPQIVGRAHNVECRAHEGRLDHLAPLERPHELPLVKVPKSRPQRHVR